MTSNHIVGDSEIRQFERDEYINVLEPVARGNLSKVQDMLVESDINALVLNRTDNLRYLTGFGPYDSFSLSAEHGAVIPEDGEPTLIAAPRIAEYLKDRHWLSDIRSFPTTNADAVDAFIAALADHDVTDGVVGIDPHMEYQFASQFERSLPRATLIDAGDLLYRARAVKSEKELALIDEGLEIAEIGIEAGIEAVEVGVQECEVSGAIMDAMLDAGAAGAYALPAIVSSGVRWSRCAEYPSKKRIRRNEFVQLDEGPMYKGYYSELARMLFLGTPSDEQRDMYQATYQAHEAAIDAIEPGATGREVFDAACDVFEQFGYEDYLTNGDIGHGIGNVAHEPPFIGPTEDVVLEENMVVMIEPGLFRPGVSGVRFEDMVVVTSSGSKVLSQTAHPHHDKFI